MDVEKKQEQPLRGVPVSVTVDEAKKRKRRRCIIIWSSVLATFATIALVLLILGLIVFKAKKPVITVDNVSLEDLDVSINPLALQVSLNLSLGLDISIENPNKVGVKYKSSSAIVRYKGDDIGNVPIPAGKIGSDDKKNLNLTLTVYADRLVTNSEIYREVLGGNLMFTTYTKIKAKVRVLFIHIHVTSTSTCDVNVDIRNRRIANQTCQYKNKL
ncbi:late embryogenesis abundant protein, LEA-14 [Artemisia annua]|uniref:Late embryogenesis abundant protein, LEA-14 n=1 Tax=Artemisia annua TaxID=35608 RepID=A0A2U1NFB4_ARTAN|nr:late embryogenesis abundant protein, LEA-14 [Artemisia annua]